VIDCFRTLCLRALTSLASNNQSTLLLFERSILLLLQMGLLFMDSLLAIGIVSPPPHFLVSASLTTLGVEGAVLGEEEPAKEKRKQKPNQKG
jgi:hypothetical protein